MKSEISIDKKGRITITETHEIIVLSIAFVLIASAILGLITCGVAALFGEHFYFPIVFAVIAALCIVTGKCHVTTSVTRVVSE